MIVFLRKEFEYHLVKIDDDKIDLISDLHYYLCNVRAYEEVADGGVIGFTENFTSYDGTNCITDLGLVIFMDDIFIDRNYAKPNYKLLQYMSKKLLIYLISLWKEHKLSSIENFELKKGEYKVIDENFPNLMRQNLEDLNKIEKNIDYYYDELMIKGIIE
jgi:hypothetical protein